jgi:integrase/recombinase XerC
MHKTKFLTYLQNLKKYSSHTIKSYALDLNQFYEFCFQNEFLENENDIVTDPRIIRKWINNLSSKAISPVSINRKISCLKSYYNYLFREGLIEKSPIQKIIRPKVKKKLPEFLREENIEQLLDSDIFKNNFVELRDKLVIELLYSTGIRRAELIGLNIREVDLNAKTIKVTGKRNKQRIIPYPETLNILLKNYLIKRSEIVTETNLLVITESGNAAYPNLIYRIVKKYITLISLIKKRSPHILRHSYATHLLNNGADINAVKELLGHASLSATQVYTHNTFEKLNRIYKQAHPRAKK